MIRILTSLCLLASCATANRDNPAVNDGPPATGDGPATDTALTPDANNCAIQPCTILPQCGCASDDACDIDVGDLDGSACRNVLANAQMEGGACNVTAGCVAGAVCAGGICRRYCDDNADCGQPRGQCLIEITNGTSPIAGIPKTCSSNCDPTNVAAGGCPANMKCALATVNGTSNIVDCDVAGAGTQGANCKVGADGDDTLCAKDHTCATGDGGTTFTCRRMCVVGGASVCGAGTCTTFTPSFLVAGINYGVCP